MNSIKHRFTLDMHSTQSQISIPASLYDTARTLYINFTDGGDPYHISEGCTALLIISKPSGAKLSEWCAIKDNTNVIYPFSQNKNTASEEGICECEITLYSAPDEDGDIEQIASPRFSIVVSERAINRGDDEVLPEASIGFIDQAAKDELVRRQKEQERQTAENARVSAETARAGAETARANAESARATAETERASAESARKTAENARASAETARASAETQRIANEEERQRNSAEYKAQVDLVREEISTWQDEWGKISSFDKRIENLEAAVSPEIVTPVMDSTVAYSKTVPKGALPNVFVTEIGGMTYVKNGVLVDSKVEAVESVGANKLDFDTWMNEIIVMNGSGTITEKGFTITATIGDDCYTAHGVNVECAKIKVKPNTKYTLCWEGYNLFNGRVYVFINGTTAQLYSAEVREKKIEFVTPDSCEFVTFRVGVNGIGNSITYSRIWCYEGEAKPYSPYIRKTLEIPEAVQNMDGYGQGVNAQYYNKIVLDPAEGVKKYIQKCLKYELSTLTWSKNSTETAWYTTFSNPISGTYITNYSDEYPLYYATELNALVLAAGQQLASIDNLKEHLQGVFTVMVFDTPVETDVSHLFTDDNLLPVETGGTITAVNEFEHEVPFTVKYMIKGA